MNKKLSSEQTGSKIVDVEVLQIVNRITLRQEIISDVLAQKIPEFSINDLNATRANCVRVGRAASCGARRPRVKSNCSCLSGLEHPHL